MELQVNNKYKTRNGLIATITHDVSNSEPIYRIKGFVSYENGQIYRHICMWTINGNYNITKNSELDIKLKL